MEIRKTVTIVEETRKEMGKDLPKPVRKAAAIAVIKNPFAGRYQEDLNELIDDGEKLGETTLELPLSSFRVGIMVEYTVNGNAGIAIYEVVGEYYDQWEDWINQIYGIMQWMIPAMFVIMLVVMVVSALGGKKQEEERKVIVVPG